MTQIKTGIAGLDWFLRGGLPPKVLLLIGISGSGNEILARQVAYSKAKENGISYFTVNSTAEYIKEEMMEFGWDINQFVESGDWKFLKIKENSSLVDIVIKEMKKNRTVVIDSLSELLLIYSDKEIITLLTTMVHQNKDGKKFHMLLLTSGMQNQQTETTMEHFAEGVIVFNTTWTKDSTLRHILVKKMQGITVPIRMLQYNLGKKGFIIETATRIN